MARYYTLIVRDGTTQKWGVHFGDYDRPLVEQERDDITDYDYKRSDTRIIVTNETQAAINAKLEQLNADV